MTIFRYFASKWLLQIISYLSDLKCSASNCGFYQNLDLQLLELQVVEIAVEAAKPDAEAKGGKRNPETEEKGAGEALYKFQ